MVTSVRSILLLPSQVSKEILGREMFTKPERSLFQSLRQLLHSLLGPGAGPAANGSESRA